MKTLQLGLILCAAFSILNAAQGDFNGSAKSMIIVNEDDSHFFRPEFGKTKEALEAYIDGMSDGHITHFFMNPNAGRTSYASKVWEPVWEPIDTSIKPLLPAKVDKHTTLDGWRLGCKQLHDAGIDPYSVWAARCRKNGISPWISVRMNDVHFITNWNTMGTSNFWRRNPQLWRVPYSKTKKWTDFAFDYSHGEVRDRMYGLIEELLSKYDVDGLELDWMRFSLHLKENREIEDAHFLTEFVARVRKLCETWGARRGHKIALSVRVNASPRISRDEVGTDAVKWAKEGLIDMIVVSPFFTSADFDISTRQWRDALGAECANVKVIPSTEDGVRANPKFKRVAMTDEMYNAWAANMYHNGADSLYMFNLIYHPDNLKNVSKRGLSREYVEGAPRRHVLSYRDFVKVSNAADREIQIPDTAQKQYALTINCGIMPPSGRKVSAIVGFDGDKPISAAEISVKLNGYPAVKSEEKGKDFSEETGSSAAFEFFFPFKALSGGYNKLEVSQSAQSPKVLSWAEIDIK